MSGILLGGATLIIGAVLALALPRNALRAAAAIASQAAACLLVAPALAFTLRTGAPLEGALGWSYPTEVIAIRVDPLSAFFLAWSLPLTLLGTMYAVGYLKPDLDAGRNGGPQFALLNMTAIAFLVVYTVQNALVFLLGWEIAAIAAWLLVIWDYRSQKVRFAGFNYLVSTHIGLFVLVAAFMLLYAETASMDLRSFGAVLARPGRLRSTTFLLLGAAFALKSAFFPFHAWAPRAYAAAPAHVAGLMSGLIHKAGLFAFLRFSLLLGTPDEWMGWSVLFFGAASAFFGVLYSSTQRDLKRLLGYSSTENVGIAAMGFGLGMLGMTWELPGLVAAGFTGGLLHLFNHALFKPLLLYAAGAVHRATRTVDIERLGGLLRRLPHTGWLFLVGGLAIAALPPLNGFVSKLVIYSGLLAGGAEASASAVFVAIAALLAFVGALGALSIVRAFGIAFLGAPRDPSIDVETRAPLTMTAPMYVHALGAVLIGLFPRQAVGVVRAAASTFGAQVDDALVASVLEPVQRAVQIFVALTIIACVIGLYLGRRARTHVTWGCGYTATNTRMQYTGSSFVAELTNIFESLLPSLRRERLPRGPFPAEPGHLATHHPDAVERRMFEVLGQGEEMISNASDRIPEQPRFAFAAGLIALVVAIGLLVGAGR